MIVRIPASLGLHKHADPGGFCASVYDQEEVGHMYMCSNISGAMKDSQLELPHLRSDLLYIQQSAAEVPERSRFMCTK